jgi:hypothetical protein
MFCCLAAAAALLQVGTIASRPLTHNLLQLYLGPDPVSKGAKESFGVGLAGMVLA